MQGKNPSTQTSFHVVFNMTRHELLGFIVQRLQEQKSIRFHSLLTFLIPPHAQSGVILSAKNIRVERLNPQIQPGLCDDLMP